MNGIILVNKDINKTSRDIVNEISKIFNTKKIGHTGTLDPIATGVLVICIGRYTKLVSKLMSLKKEYIATIKLGILTDTLDITGNILDKKSVNVKKDDIIKVLNSLKGKITQEIPLYSAKKINGKKLYEYARNGIKVELPKNEVEIFDINLIEYKDDKITFKTTVSKGTYIRSLIQIICEKLNAIGTMSKLIRTKQGDFDISKSYTTTDIKNNNYKLLSVKDIFNYQVYNLNEVEYFKVKNGNSINLNINDEYVILYYKEKEIAIYKKENNNYKIDIMLEIE